MEHETPTGEINGAIYALLHNAAVQNLPCPDNATIRDMLGYEESHTVSRSIHRMAGNGSFRIIRVCQVARDGEARQIIFPDGHETLCPIEAVTDVIAKAGVIFGVKVSAIYGPERCAKLARARQAAMAVSCEAGYGPTMVGRVLARDHSTVHHAIATVRQYEARNAVYSLRMRELRYAAGLLPELQMAA